MWYATRPTLTERGCAGCLLVCGLSTILIIFVVRIMDQNRLAARAFCRYEVAVETLDLKIVDGDAFGVRFPTRRDKQGLLAMRIDDAVAGLEVTGGGPAKFRLRPEWMLVGGFEGLFGAGGRLEGEVAEMVGDAAEDLLDAFWLKLPGGGVHREDVLAGANVLDVEEVVGLAADAVVAGDVRVE